MAAVERGRARRRTQEERSASTQQKLAKAAFELIRDNGFANFRVASVAREAGVSQGGQLHHFPTKDALTMAAIDYAIEIAQARSAENLACYSATDDVIDAIAADSCDYYFSASFDVAMDVAKGSAANSALRAAISAAHRKYRRFVEDGWREVLVQQGWRTEDAEDLIAMTTSLVRGFAIRTMIRPYGAQLERLLGRWRDMVRRCFAGAM